MVNAYIRSVFNRELENIERDKFQFLVKNGDNSREWVRQNKKVLDRKTIKIDVSIKELSKKGKWVVEYLGDVDFKEVSKLNEVLGNCKVVKADDVNLSCQGQYWVHLALYEGYILYHVSGIEKIEQIR